MDSVLDPAARDILSSPSDYQQATGKLGGVARGGDLPQNPGPWALVGMTVGGRRTSEDCLSHPLNALSLVLAGAAAAVQGHHHVLQPGARAATITTSLYSR